MINDSLQREKFQFYERKTATEKTATLSFFLSIQLTLSLSLYISLHTAIHNDESKNRTCSAPINHTTHNTPTGAKRRINTAHETHSKTSETKSNQEKQ